LHTIPNVLRLRDAGSLVHRMGRYFSGLETEATMRSRTEHSLWREAWLLTHDKVLLQHAMAWHS
jgi:homoserine kinase type II